MRLKRVIGAAAVGAAVATLAAMPLTAAAQQQLVVWWTKGFYPAEDKALNEFVARFEKKYNAKVDLSLYAVQDVIPKTVAALGAGSFPDVAMGHTFDFQVAGKWAAEGRLADLTDVIDPIKDKFLDNTTSTAFFTGTDGKRAYYAMPIYQQTMHVNYWKDMLAEAGFKPADVPTGWKEYWSFWCDKVQPAHRKASGKRTFAIGHPMGVDGSDSFFSFHQFMLAHKVKLVDDDGKVIVDTPDNRKALAAALKDYTDIAVKGCTPASAINWKDPDNNVNFHNKTTLMTHNATISIASKWLDDANNASLTQAERDQAKKNYEDNIETALWPNKPDGSPMNYLAAIKLAVVFKGARNEKLGKQFLQFLMEDENIIPYTEGSLGRWYAVTKKGADSPFWTQQDVHRKKVSAQFRAGTDTFPFTRNFNFTTLNNENVWAKGMSRVVNDKWTPDKAADEIVARIKELAGGK
ncbi:MAG: ABC transporter substrate-binding protein [Lautropia sp.]